MKKLMIMSAAMALMVSPMAFAKGDKSGEKGDRKGHHGKMFEKLDANGDGVVSEAEFVKAMKVRFSEMDADNSGDVTKEEARAHMKSKHDKWKKKRGEFQGKRESKRELNQD